MSRKIRAPHAGIVRLFNITARNSISVGGRWREIVADPPRDPDGRPGPWCFMTVLNEAGTHTWTSYPMRPGSEFRVSDGDHVKKGQKLGRYSATQPRPVPGREDIVKGRKERPLTRGEKDRVNANVVKTALERESWPCRYGRRIDTGAAYGLVELDFFASENDKVIKANLVYIDHDDGQEFYMIRLPFPGRKAKPWVVYTEGMRCDIDPQKTAYRAWLEILDGVGIDPYTTTDVTDYAEEDEDESGPHGFHFHE